MRVTKDAHNELSRLAFTLTGKTQRRVSLSDAIQAACAIAFRHLDETVNAVPKADSEDQAL